MPRRNGTGPMGQGASTGRGLGLCDGGNVRFGGRNQSFKRGMGIGARKRRNGSYTNNEVNAVTKEEITLQINQMQEEIKRLEQLLNTI